MKNVLIIKGANFSSNKVETIPLVEQLVYNYENMLNVDKELQINGSSMIVQSNNYGGFIAILQESRGQAISVINDGSTSYIGFIKNVNFDAKTFSYCEGTSLTTISPNTTYNGTVPSDCDYVYVFIHNLNGFKSTTTVIMVPIS